MNYQDTRTELKNVADHTVQSFSSIDLKKTTTRYIHNNTFSPPEERKTEILVLPQDSFISASEVIQENPLVLNMASWKHPGGGFLHGAGTQEEDLCRRSTLYWHIKRERYPFKEGEALYTPEVIVFKDVRGEKYKLLRPKDQIKLAVITIPAAKISPTKSKLDEKSREVMEKQIDTLFGCARENGHETLVLGAWGCGAFNCPSEEVAEMFDKAIKKWKPKKVIFAVLCRGRSGLHNYQTFYNKLVQE